MNCRCKVQNGRQLVFTYVDEEGAGGRKVIQNAPIKASYNRHMVTAASTYQVDYNNTIAR